MNNLLIHYENVPFVESFELAIKFSASNDIDGYISNTILPLIKDKNPDIIFIKDNLSSNYLELYGLRLAYHIRFEESLKLLPIVILSDIDGFTLNRLEPMANILFTKNIFIIENNKKAFDNFEYKKIKPFTQEEYKSKFLDLITVEPPENSSSHSIANEWAINRWAKFLEVKSEVITTNRDKISSMLYFKYLLAKNPMVLEDNKNDTLLKHSGKVLLIDDDSNKGWGIIFKKFFSLNDKIEFIVYGDKNKNINLKSIDVIILDLRITKDDHNKDRKIEELTGIKYAQRIKKENPGIQIIMFTATGNSLILDELYKYNILGYIKKEHPEDKNLTTSENFAKLSKLTAKGFEKSYLKEIWEMQKKILALQILKNNDENSIKIKSEIETIFEILNSDLENNIKFTILTIFKVLEILCDSFKLTGSEFIRITSLFKNNNLDEYNTDISQLICTRNFLVHSGNKDKLAPRCIKQNNLIENPKKDHILTWFKMLQTILEKIDKDTK